MPPWLTGFRVLCSLNVSSSTKACSLDNLSFFLDASASASPPHAPPSSSSLPPPPRELDVLSFSSPFPSLSLRFPLMLDIVLFGEDTPFSSSNAARAAEGGGGGKFTSIPRKNDRISELRSVKWDARESVAKQVINSEIKGYFCTKQCYNS